MGQSRYIIGIDLGTTNSAVAYVDLGDRADEIPIRLFRIPQLVAEGKVAHEAGLPSFLYLPGTHDLPDGAVALPWAAHRDYAVGKFARDQGAKVPARLISSAKSWLCHSGVDREAPILPWGSPSDVPHLSPVEVSARYIQHIQEAWDQEMSQGRAEWCLAQSDVVLTVPASFDEVARNLTLKAAQHIGLKRLTLLEEPQAAFYSWVRAQGEFWHEQLSDGQKVLVCDVGGGTTDFSLIAVHGSALEMTLERIAIGEHLMLGGDNMDLALARHLETRLVKRIGELDAKQWAMLVHACRDAKEQLLSSVEMDRYGITLTGRGSKVVGGSMKLDVFRDEVQQIVLDGFFPSVTYDDPTLRGRSGFKELGLPYAADPAITRNLSAFLRRHDAKPDAILFNGGAMKSTMAQDRVIEAIGAWFGKPPEVLESQSLDLAVALGAAAYGLVRAGNGVRIRGGTARSYYVGIGDHSTKQSGSRRAVCVIPFGLEEGEELQLQQHRFELVTDRPVSFPLYSSTAPLGHDAGDLVDITPDVFIGIPPLQTVLNSDSRTTHETVPVRIGAKLSELGTLQLWCDAETQRKRWNLEFSLRDREESENARRKRPTVSVGDQSLEIQDSVQHDVAMEIRGAFRLRDVSDEQGPRTVIKRLEQKLGAERLAWPGDVIRSLWSPLWEVVSCRAYSPEHETAWLNLAGILLRPGFGDALDEQRVDQAWQVFREGLRFPDQLWCRIGWWVLWRRISGGLQKGQQLELSNKLSQPLLSGAALKASGGAAKGNKKAKKGKIGDEINRQELAEMWRVVASLERLPVSSKEGFGDVALRNAIAGRGDFAFWALGRLGARVPLYGPVEEVVSTEKAETWLERLLGIDWKTHRQVALAVTQIARRCGDTRRDIDHALRDRIVARLTDIESAPHLIQLVREVTVLDDGEKAQLFGDALPTGLRLAVST